MKAQVSIFVTVFVAVFINQALSDECDSLPEGFKPEGCCKFPPMETNQDTVKKVMDQFKDQKLDEFMTECKISEAMFKELKLIKNDVVDSDALLKHIDSSIKEENWKPIMKAAGNECIKDISEKKDEIIKALEGAPFNIKKDQCNVTYMSLVTCIHLEGFANCPKESWTDEKKCNDAKAWIMKCGDDIDSLKQLVSAKSQK